MRHRRKINHLSRKTAHRRQMLANMASSLIMHKRIHTTLAKAKALRVYIEPIITRSKTDNTHSRRVVFSYLQNKDAVSELFRDISVKVADRPGGYTRIIKIGARLGDNAEMCMMELVDYNENLLGTQEAGKVKSTRRRRGRGGKKSDTPETATATVAASEAAPVEAADDVKEEAIVEDVTAEEVKDEAVVESQEEKAEEPVKEQEPAAEEKPAEEPVAEVKEEEPKAEKPAEDESNEEGDKDDEKTEKS